MLKKIALVTLLASSSFVFADTNAEGPTQIAECNEMYHFALNNGDKLGLSKERVEQDRDALINETKNEPEKMKTLCAAVLTSMQESIK